MNDFYLDQKLNDACLEGNLKLVRYWLTSPEAKRIHGRNANIDGVVLQEKVDCHLTPLMAACRAGHLEVVKYLLTSPEIVQAGYQHADVEALRGGAVNWASLMGHFEIVRHLLTSPDIVRSKLYDDHHAFYYACENRHWHIVKYLLASPDIVNAGGKHANIEANLRAFEEKGYRSALEAICQHNHRDFIYFLVFEYFLERTAAVASITEQYPEIDKLFYVREDHYGLSQRLDEQEAGRRTKI